MEEIKRSLATGSSSSIKLEAVTSLYSRILTGPDQEAALKLVWTGLRSEDCLTCQASADLLIVLVRTEKLEIGSTITQLLACLSQGMEYSGLVPALGELIILQAARQIRQTGEFRQSYSISSSQHPLLAVLRSTPATWSLSCRSPAGGQASPNLCRPRRGTPLPEAHNPAITTLSHNACVAA